MQSLLHCVSALAFAAVASEARAPNIVFVLVDDVGFADVSYQHEQGSAAPIQTPHIDDISSHGTRLSQHYAAPMCTPTRASLLTGRYPANVGLTWALLPGSPAGLPDGIPTLPRELKNRGYATHMTGKWHLGHSQWRKTPVGQGFESFTGSFMFDADPWTKQVWQLPFKALSVDWVNSHANGTWSHFSEPRHSTEAITQDAEAVMRKHKIDHPDQPLFMYVAYTAAHSPLQPMARHAAECTHIQHGTRRNFCGMIKGLDEAMYNLTNTIQSELGEDTILVFSSDNGGSTWVGGNNQPLRGGKTTPLEGGTRVPAFVRDFSKDQRYLGPRQQHEGQEQEQEQQRKGPSSFTGMVHISDWLPTLLHLADGDEGSLPEGLDGVSQLEGLRGQSPPARTEMLYEMLLGSEVHNDEDIRAYREGNMKLVEGWLHDPHHYSEPRQSWLGELDQRALGGALHRCCGDWLPLHVLNSSDPSYTTSVGDSFLALLDAAFGGTDGAGRLDMTRNVLVHNRIHPNFMTQQPPCCQDQGHAAPLALYNLETDPEERHNLLEDGGSDEMQTVAQRLRAKMDAIQLARPHPQQKYWVGKGALDELPALSYSGEGLCASSQPPFVTHPWRTIKESDCRFAHPWIDDSVSDEDLWGPGYAGTDNIKVANNVTRKINIVIALLMALWGVAALVCCRRCCCRGAASRDKSKTD